MITARLGYICQSENKKHATATTSHPTVSHCSQGPQCTCSSLTMSWLSNIRLTNLPSWLPSRNTARHILIGVLLGLSFSMTSTSLALYHFYPRRRRERLVSNFTPRPIELRSDEIVKGVSGLIGMPSWLIWERSFSSGCQPLITGNTPLVRVDSLSDALGIEILGKAEVSVAVTYSSEIPNH